MKDNRKIDTEGAAYIEGNVDIKNGDFVQGDKLIANFFSRVSLLGTYIYLVTLSCFWFLIPFSFLTNVYQPHVLTSLCCIFYCVNIPAIFTILIHSIVKKTWGTLILCLILLSLITCNIAIFFLIS